MLYKIVALIFVGLAAAAPVIEEVEKPEVAAEHGRELFPLVAAKARRAGLATRASSRAAAASVKMLSDNVKGPINALEMLALNDDMNTVVESNDMCTRRKLLIDSKSATLLRATNPLHCPLAKRPHCPHKNRVRACDGYGDGGVVRSRKGR